MTWTLSLVTAGLDPAVHADFRPIRRTSQRMMPSHKSRQSGFSVRMRSIFHARDQCLIFFSRWMQRAQWHVARIDKHLYAMLSAEPLDQPFAVLIDATDQIIRHADIERAVRAARQNVNPITFHAEGQHGLPGQARQ
jgi:hypothetical protein